MRKNLRNRKDLVDKTKQTQHKDAKSLKKSVDVYNNRNNKTERDRLKTSSGTRPKWADQLSSSIGGVQMQIQ